MTTMDNSANVTPVEQASTSPAMSLLQAIRAGAESETGLNEPAEHSDIGIEEPSEPQAEERQEEQQKPDERPEAAKPDDDFIEITGEEGQEPTRIKVADAVQAYQELRALEGKVDQVVALAEERTQERAQQIYQHQDTQLKQTIDVLQVWHTGLKAMAPQPPNTMMLNPNSDKYDPDGYHTQLATHNQIVGAFQQIDANLRAAVAERQRLAEEQHEQLVKANLQRLFRADPEWRTNFRAFGEEVMSVMQDKYGFDEDALMSISDHRFFLAARDLVRYHKMKGAGADVRARVEKAAPKLVKSEKSAPGRQQDRGKDGRYITDAAKALATGPYTQEKGKNFFLAKIRAGQL